MSALSVYPNPRVSFKIIHKEEGFLIVEKPAGLSTQPGIGHLQDTLLNGLFHSIGPALQQLGKKRDFGLLHRLDAATSGLLIVGLQRESYDLLRDAFVAREIEKGYLALLNGAPPRVEGIIDGAIEECRREGRKVALVHSTPSAPRAKAARTRYRVLARSETASLVACRLETGRLHQIRAHFASLGAPVIGDFDYGGARPLNNELRAIRRGSLGLHAASLRFRAPSDGRELNFVAPLPDHLLELMRMLSLDKAKIKDPLSLHRLTTLEGPYLRPPSRRRDRQPAQRSRGHRGERRPAEEQRRQRRGGVQGRAQRGRKRKG
ncbi:MAG: RluA family pseudouridine synthase [Myxococcota bacterium]|nr:RluA family pseudouridine synthase [Myxococcota bacterium]